MKQTLVALSALFAVFGLPFGALAADEAPVRVTVSQQDVDESLGTEWYGCYALGKKVGFARFSLDLAGRSGLERNRS
jgi:hypothetical protein